MQKQFLVFIFILSSISSITAQKDAAVKESIQALVDLKKGAILVVKLPTGTKKLNAIAKDSALNFKNKAYVQRLAKIKQQEIVKNTKIQLGLMNGLKQFYTFTPFVAVFDTCYDKLLKNNAIESIFYDENLTIKKDFNLREKSFFTFRLDQDLVGVRNKHTIFVITDKNGQQLKAPFPSQIPYKFRWESVLNTYSIQIFDSINFTNDNDYLRKPFMLEKQSASKTSIVENGDYSVNKSFREMDKNVYIATIKMLQLKLTYFEDFVTQDKYLKKTNN